MVKRRTHPTSIRLPEQLKLALEAKSELTGLRPATLAVMAIAQFLDPNNQPPPNAT
ncbi:hypothetical protein NC981_19220 [Leptolyngbya sp. DQ-M1]|uniref:hypothetical protein n=1 Tax=Leptolyngbya sp. DQ-M1 TaxID=2933920 RepID=UPI0032977270